MHELGRVEPLQFASLGIGLHSSVFCPFDREGSASSLRAEVFGKNKGGRKVILFHCIVFGCARKNPAGDYFASSSNVAFFK